MGRRFAFLFCGLIISGWYGSAFGHDVFLPEKQLNQSTLLPTGPSCCGGGETVGDCEHLATDQIQVHPGGGMRIYSKRYGKWVEVARDIIQTKRIPGAPSWAAGAWCGVPYPPDTSDPFQPDPNMRTYCAHLSPGDV